MTGNTTQAVLDAVDLLSCKTGSDSAAVRARFGRMLRAIVWFALGCGTAALLYYFVGFWCLAVPAVVGATTAILRDQA